MELQALLSMLEGVQNKGGGQYMARCPCHDDRKASLAVKMGDDKIILQCLAGCAYEDILARLGISWKDLMRPEALEAMEQQRRGQGKRRSPAPAAKAEPRQAAAKPKRDRREADVSRLATGKPYRRKVKMADGNEQWAEETITDCYVYDDDDGREVMRVYRTDGKSFPTIYADEGKWWWGDGGHTHMLYRLPELMRAIRARKPICLVEGEKDVETLRAMGFAATTGKGGAGKWSDEQTEALRGAQVYIIPDLDEPGWKHARLVARALRDAAAEVRIINLARQREAEIPPKGDVSDLAKALGRAGARRVLSQLIEASPVLSRVVSDEDYADWFEGIPGCAVRSACICTVTADGSLKQLSNFVALPVEQVLVDDGSGAPRYQLTIEGWSATGSRLPTLTVPVNEFDGMRWPLARWGLCANVADGNGVLAKLRRIIQEAGLRAAVHRTLYCHTGWRKIDGKLCFLHGGGAIGAEDVQVKLDFGLERYCLDGIRSGPYAGMPRAEVLPICQGATLRVMHAPGLRVGAPVMGFLFLAPLRYFLEMRGHRPSFVPYLVGTTGTGKTTYLSLALNHFGYDFSFEGMQPATFDDSPAAMAQKLYELKDLPLFVDDYKREADPQRQKARKSLEEIIIRMIADGMRRSRMTGEMDAQHDRFARGVCIQTGEELPDVTISSVARLYVIELETGDIPVPHAGMSAGQAARLREMEELWQMARDGVLNETMRGYIEYLQGISGELPELLDKRLSELRQEVVTRTEGEHARMLSAVSYLMLGVSMLLDYLVAPGSMMEGDEGFRASMMDKCWDAMVGNNVRQAAEMRGEKPTAVFLTTLRELLASGRNTVETLGHVSAIVPRDVLGYRDEDYYYLIPGECYGAVQKSLAQQGTALATGKNTLINQLREEKKLICRDGKSALQQIKRGGIHGRFLVMPRWVLEDTDPVYKTEQGTFLQVEDAGPFEEVET